MSGKTKGFIVEKIICPKCGGDMFYQGGRGMDFASHPKIKGSFQWREFVCEKCGQIIRTGGFLQE